MSGVGGDQLHVMVADVIESFDTVDRSILDCTLGSLGLPGWFRRTYLAHHSQVRLRFKLTAGLGESWCRDGWYPTGLSFEHGLHCCSLDPLVSVP